jgi:hypothetical protein
MSYFDDASLVMIPSGYKDQKVYSVKPLDGSGDLTFSRASSATRVQSDGLIEKVRTNLVTYSNTFTNAAWTKVGSNTFTAGQADYLGGTNAWKWASNAIATVQISQNVTTSAASANHSVYAKAGSVSTFNIWVGTAVTFDLSAGTVTAGTGTITSVGNGWYRCSVNRNTVSSTNSFNPYFAAAAANDFVYISFAQTEESDIATDYIATTTAAVSVGPVSGLPRLDYLGSTCGKLLLEPQRSNLTLFSEQLDNANYTLLNLTIAANNTTSPDGTQSAEKITETTANGEHLLYAIQSTALGTYTMSAFFKAGGGTVFPVLRFNGNTTNAYAGCVFNTTTGQVVNTFSNTYTGTTTKVDNMGNGWYRVSLTTTTNETTFGVRIASSNTATPTIGAFGAISYAGNTNNFFYAWGAQLEAGAYATSYIPTLGTSVTRVADAAFKTGISSLIGQTNGTFFVDVTFGNSNSSWFFSLASTNWTDDSFYLETFGANNYISINTVKSGAGAGNVSSTFAAVNGVRAKIAVQYTSTTLNLFINGVKYTGTRTAIPACTGLYIDELGTFGASDNQKNTNRFNQVLTFTSALTDAQCIELTTL